MSAALAPSPVLPPAVTPRIKYPRTSAKQRLRQLAARDRLTALPLRVNDHLFVNAYLSNGQNATQAYLMVHPNCKYATAEVGGHRVLRKPKVQAEVARRLEHEQGITLKGITTDLLTARDWAHEVKDYAALAAIAIDCAKLGGFLVEKREVKTLSDEDKSAIRSLVAQAMPGHSQVGVS